MKAALYIRVSTNQQATEGVSLKAQRQRLIKYCEFNGLEVTEIIEDSGLSGTDTNREGYKQLMKLVSDSNVNAVCVYSLSRFARNTVEVLNSIEKMNKNNIQFHSLTEKIDTTTPTGRFFLTTLAALGQLEREQLAERTRAALQHKKSNSERVGSIPYGYELSSDGVHLIENEREQKIIKLVLSMRALGYSYQRIANELSNKGLRTKRNHTNWGAKTVYNIYKSNAA